MNATKAFLRQLSKNGLYIILFLCISAIGIAGYVMYRETGPEIPVEELTVSAPQPIEEYKPIVIEEEPKEKEVAAPAPEVKEKAVPIFVTAEPIVTEVRY